MLEHTFVHIPGIGRTTEQRLWAAGVRTWADADRAHSCPPGIRPRAWALLQTTLPASRQALAAQDAAFFARLCVVGEAWRLFSRFGADCVYLDIETTGLTCGVDEITLVGVYDGAAYKSFIAGDNLPDLPEYLQRFRLISTFNGAGFDLRFLRAAFPGLALPPLHIDLRPTSRKLGLTGGLKAVEVALGLQRDGAVRDLSGFDAVQLWRRHLRGDKRALDLLIEYNRADVVHLQTILAHCADTLVSAAAQQFGLAPLSGPPERSAFPQATAALDRSGALLPGTSSEDGADAH